MRLVFSHNLFSFSGTACFLAGILFLNVNVFAQVGKDMQTSATPSYAASVHIGNADRALQNWILNCQGCHGVKAVPLVADMPKLNGHVSKFLSVEGGRQFLGHVPGIATAPLSDAELADLVNWMFLTFDPENIPEKFEEYTSEEIGHLRATPLSSDIAEVRNELIKKIKTREVMKRATASVRRIKGKKHE